MTGEGRLALAAAVSIGVHLLLAAGDWWRPERPVPPAPLEVRLERVAVAPPAPTASVTPSAQARRAPARRMAAGGASQPRRAPVPSAAPRLREPQPTTVPTDDDGPTVPGEAVAAATGEPAAASAPAVQTEEAAAEAEPAQPAGAAPRLPRRGTIRYALSYGRDGFDVGMAVQKWEIEDGRYLLASDAQTTGIVDLFRPQRLRWLSKGSITRSGLRPDSFLVSRTRRQETEAASARFDWEAGTLTYGTARERKTTPLAGGAQDIMSFIYHLALLPPPPGRFRVPITTGSRYEEFEIEVRTEEEIDTPLGTLRALPVRQRPRPGAESIEIWLAADYRNLPVRIRYFDRDGRPAGEQVASEIQVSED